MDPWLGHVLYGAGWVSFGLGHSLLIHTPWLHHWFGHAHRLAFNGIAVVHLALVWLLGLAVLGNAPYPDLPVWLDAALIGLQVAGLVLGAVALGGYDLGRLGGLTQWRNGQAGIAAPEDEPLRTDGLHRWVRHPLYLAGFLILWGASRDAWGAATAVWGTAYLLAGTVFEERRLIRIYGDAYRAYRRRVPAFFPWRRPLPQGDDPGAGG